MRKLNLTIILTAIYSAIGYMLSSELKYLGNNGKEYLQSININSDLFQPIGQINTSGVLEIIEYIKPYSLSILLTMGLWISSSIFVYLIKASAYKYELLLFNEKHTTVILQERIRSLSEQINLNLDTSSELLEEDNTVYFNRPKQLGLVKNKQII